MKRGVRGAGLASYTERVRLHGIGRLLFTIATWVIAEWTVLASAHEDQAFHLAGMRFCIDPKSVHVALEVPDAARLQASEQLLREELLATLTATLQRSQVAYEALDSCERSEHYLLLVADVRYLDPKVYLGFGDQSYNYNLVLQVGDFVDEGSARELQPLPNGKYDAYLGEIYAETESRPFEPFVVRQGAQLVNDLGAYWWEDNPPRTSRLALLPPLLGSVLALLSAAAVWWRLRRRGLASSQSHGSRG